MRQWSMCVRGCSSVVSVCIRNKKKTAACTMIIKSISIIRCAVEIDVKVSDDCSNREER